MRFDRLHISKELLLTTDVMNTLNGGISQPRVTLNRLTDRYILCARIPGVNPECMQVDIRNDKIFLFHHIALRNIDYYQKVSSVPFNIGFVMIPFDVNIKAISAVFENKELLITLPFNDLAGGYNKTIEIRK